MLAPTFLVLLSPFLVTAQRETVRIHALEPTAPGQIGVNRWEPIVASNTQYYSYGQTTEKWIGVNTEYILETVVVTSVGVTATSTTLVPFAVSTVSVPSGAAEVGDLAIVAAPAGKAALKELFKQIEVACGSAKKFKRQVNSCVPNYLRQPHVLDPIREFFPSNILVTAGTVQKWELAGEYALTGLTLVGIYALWNYSENKKTGKIPDESLMPSAAINFELPNNATISSKRPYAPYFTAIERFTGKPFQSDTAIVLASYMDLVMVTMFPEITAVASPTSTAAPTSISTSTSTSLPGHDVSLDPEWQPWCAGTPGKIEDPELQISWDEITEQVTHFCTCWDGYKMNKNVGKVVHNDYIVSGHAVAIEWGWLPGGHCYDGLMDNEFDYWASKDACIGFLSQVAHCKPLFVTSIMHVRTAHCLVYWIGSSAIPKQDFHPKDIKDLKKCY